MKNTWVEINYLFENNTKHKWIVWSVKDDGY
jgi:hypothetical protein